MVSIGQTSAIEATYSGKRIVTTAINLTEASILRRLGLTLWLTAALTVCGYLLGIGLAAMRLSGNPMLTTVLATVGGILVVVGVGGGLIVPMRARWAKVLDRAEQE